MSVPSTGLMANRGGIIEAQICGTDDSSSKVKIFEYVEAKKLTGGSQCSSRTGFFHFLP